MYNAFTTQISRFCPTQPGSGLVTGPTYLDAPEPGTYYVAPNWREPRDIDKRLIKYKSKEHKSLKIIPTPKPNSIPVRKLAQTSYTGRGNDTVGPAGYNPKKKTGRAPEFDFTQSKVERKLWEHQNVKHNTMTSPSNPGPGTYDFSMLEKKNFSANGEYEVFKSKVPNCKDAKIKAPNPGPGTYKNT